MCTMTHTMPLTPRGTAARSAMTSPDGPKSDGTSFRALALLSPLSLFPPKSCHNDVIFYAGPWIKISSSRLVKNDTAVQVLMCEDRTQNCDPLRR